MADTNQCDALKKIDRLIEICGNTKNPAVTISIHDLRVIRAAIEKPSTPPADAALADEIKRACQYYRQAGRVGSTAPMLATQHEHTADKIIDAALRSRPDVKEYLTAGYAALADAAIKLQVSAIEDAIACDRMPAAMVFTKMREIVNAALRARAVTDVPPASFVAYMKRNYDKTAICDGAWHAGGIWRAAREAMLAASKGAV